MNSSFLHDPKLNLRTANQGSETYGCLSCRAKFRHPPGPTECIICGSIRVKWLSYEDFVNRSKKHGNHSNRRAKKTRR